jgi:hypothetical protein
MIKRFTPQLLLLMVALVWSGPCTWSQHTTTRLVFHDVKTDSNGHILPWFSPEPGSSYDHAINLVWDFWYNIRRDYNGLPYYMNHAIWDDNENDAIAIGGDQLQMALSSWRLYYAYSGKKSVYENMKFITDYYLTHSLSGPNCQWPDLPYPCNTLAYIGFYDGDMILGRGYTQPDKAGSFGWELLNMHKLTTTETGSNKVYPQLYLEAAIKIANTLARNIKPGDADHSPLPFKVHTETGEVGRLINDKGETMALSEYTTNWSATLSLWNELIRMKQGDTRLYQQAFDLLLKWMKDYPLKNNKWGPFFEDVPGWSDTQINAITFAQFMMANPSLFPDWKKEVAGIFDWVYEKLGNENYKDLGVVVINEQTSYPEEGNSHTARQASAELQYCSLTGDLSRKAMAIRQLNWATYMVNDQGVSQYPIAAVWMTDGYGDYVRHYLRSMAAFPELAPGHINHLLHSTSVINLVEYAPLYKGPYHGKPEDVLDRIEIYYTTYDLSSTETIRMVNKPAAVWMSGSYLKELSKLNTEEGWTWQPLRTGGILTIRHDKGNKIAVLK